MRRKKIAVEEIVHGMYVAELDRPWIETPFPFQGFYVRSDAQIELLRKYSRTVLIDVDLDESAQARGGIGATPLPGIRRQTYKEAMPIERELPQARDMFASAESFMAGALRDAASGSLPNAPAIKEEVGKITESVMRNPHAAALLSAMREGAEYLLDRAMHTSVYLIVFTRFLGMERGDIERAGTVGLLQDIAMASLPTELVVRAGALKPDEVALVRTHVAKGVERLAAMPGLGDGIAELAGMHHERHDGSGYPKGLRGAQLPTIAACSALVDTYSAMTRARPYAEPIPPSKALGMLHKWRGKTFHPDLVEEFIRCVGAFPVGSVVELSTGEVGIVISQEPNKRLQPRVVVVKDGQGNPLRPQKILDLARPARPGAQDAVRIKRTLEYGRGGVGLRDLAFA